VPGYDVDARRTVKHAWKADPEETGTLRRQLEAMPDGGTFVMSVPPAPFRCPSAPYERVCLVAHYFKQAKPKSKIIVLDANPDLVAKKGLFLAAWKKHYGFGSEGSMIDYLPNNRPRSLDVRKMTITTEYDDVRADVLNVVPPMRAAEVCGLAGVRAGPDGKDAPWCSVDPRSLESTLARNVHILGDSALTPYPKSASTANNAGKMCAYALSEQFAGRPVDPAPVLTDTCYSASTDTTAFHMATVYRWNAEKQAMLAEPNAHGVSRQESELEYHYMESWAKNLWADTLGI
jgi:hypothetical protein